MDDELSAKRREKATCPADLTPRDALLEAMETVDAKPMGITAKSVIVIIRGETEDGFPSMSMVIGGEASHDAAAGLMMRAVNVITQCDHG